ncbi:hypothetical protein FA95DRAFT_1562037 [Auriscalpium vulgare]|uniref:Uncharacterized protein n=1 Tax=Auriscalpium vulgare TaxID=40419 RepID=A0ACB8RKY2_9AGAM|nr:hypothetical protein FA95DRAFT_1562037 [Auriscalpium vulgare]
MYTNSFHPVKINRTKNFHFAQSYTRAQSPPRYYLIDFGLSGRYFSSNGPARRTVAEIMAEIVPDKPLPDALEIEKRRNFLDRNAKLVQALENSAPEHDDDGDDEEVPPVENLKILIDILEAESKGAPQE